MGKNNRGAVKIYRMGKSFHKYRIVAYVLCSLVIFGFFAIYDYLFPNFGSAKFCAIFIFIEFAAMILIKRAGDWVIENYYYEASPEALSIVSGKNRQVYPWKDFSSVRLNDFDFANLCPFEYKVGGKKLSINQYLDNPWDLNCYIMDHIRDYAEVPEQLYHQADVMRK